MADAYKCDLCGKLFESSPRVYSYELEYTRALILIGSRVMNNMGCQNQTGIHMENQDDVCKECFKDIVTEIYKKVVKEKKTD